MTLHLPAVAGEEPDARIPLSTNLAMLCLFDKGETDGAFGPRHLVILGWRLTGPLDLVALQGALDDVVVRHEILRTVIVRDDGEPYQQVRAPGSPRLEVVTLPADDPRSRDVVVDEFINGVEAGTMSVNELPHLRAVVGRFDDKDAVLTLITHHIASDGWSLHVLLRDIAAFYAARRGFGAPDLPPARQYGEYARWQQEDLAGAAADVKRSYWRDKLKGVEITDIRADRRLTPQTTAVYSVYRFVVDEELTAGTLNLARTMRSSPFMVLLSAFNVLMHKMTGIVDLVSSTITSGRIDPSFNDTIGPFFNLVPLRTDLSDCRSFMELVRRTRTTCLEAYANELPFGDIAAQAPDLTNTYTRDDGAVVAFQLLQNPAMTEPELVGDMQYAEVRERYLSCAETSDIPNGVLWGMDMMSNGKIGGTIRFNSKQFDEATIVRMVDDYRRILTNGVADPQRPMSAL
ncbi:condensation domain-containing protein [Dactylosporangium sp. CA-152071]|uniref:condensation domain-containing protein n=1 Tax=Dactylosporangium sp. CA-152071 TaxID=3239933 RepID=UPI003D8F6B9D